jgi:hypothetical protein
VSYYYGAGDDPYQIPYQSLTIQCNESSNPQKPKVTPGVTIQRLRYITYQLIQQSIQWECGCMVTSATIRSTNWNLELLAYPDWATPAVQKLKEGEGRWEAPLSAAYEVYTWPFAANICKC